MQKIDVALNSFVDKLASIFGNPAAMKQDCLQGWPIKIAIVIALVEIIMALGTWGSFGWTVVIELVLLIIALYLNRYNKTIGVWIMALLTLLVYPGYNFFH
jgi:hypothetical protein